jgi:mRNA-degrading endonuclease HigB of HigAB toxin-antitoxin module
VIELLYRYSGLKVSVVYRVPDDLNIGGNRVRLIAAIHYNRKRVYIRAVLTHTEYDEGRWKE